MTRESLFDDTGATFSDDGQYRYRLWRTWDRRKEPCAFIMLNPSTADASVNDPTVRRCIGYAQRWGCGGLVVGNIFALRSTDPKALYGHDDPVGPDNDAALADIAVSAGLVVCAWGRHGALNGRATAVLDMLRRTGATPMALSFNADGSPGHPLYLPSNAEPVEVLDG